MKCESCGQEVENGLAFCPYCGAELKNSGNPDSSKFYSGNTVTEESTVYSGNVVNATNITQRNIALAIILSLITCGIYAIYWFIKITDEVNELSLEPEATGGVLAFILTLVTCGIYGLYWAYKLGERVDKINGQPGGSTGVLYLVLNLFGLGIVVYALAQDTINKAIS